MTPKVIVLKAKTCVAKMATANVVLHMLVPKIIKGSDDKAQAEHVVNKGEEVKLTWLSPEQQKKLNSKLDLTGIGFPEKILSDQGRNLMSNLIAELCKLVQIKMYVNVCQILQIRCWGHCSG